MYLLVIRLFHGVQFVCTPYKFWTYIYLDVFILNCSNNYVYLSPHLLLDLIHPLSYLTAYPWLRTNGNHAFRSNYLNLNHVDQQTINIHDYQYMSRWNWLHCGVKFTDTWTYKCTNFNGEFMISILCIQDYGTNTFKATKVHPIQFINDHAQIIQSWTCSRYW